MRCGKLTTMATPLKTSVIAVHQTWHRRFHKNPANGRLRHLACRQLKADWRNASAASANLNLTTP